MHALARGQAVGLDRHRQPQLGHRGHAGLDVGHGDRARAVGTPAGGHDLLGEGLAALQARRGGRRAEGADARRRAGASQSPATSGASGPTTTRSAAIVRARSISPSPSVTAIGRTVASRAMPAFPGAQTTLWPPRRAASTSACSRPPPPTIRTVRPTWGEPYRRGLDGACRRPGRPITAPAAPGRGSDAGWAAWSPPRRGPVSRCSPMPARSSRLPRQRRRRCTRFGPRAGRCRCPP